jgi:hypothetical protein
VTTKTKPNDLAREAMAKAADEFDQLAINAELEADLWRQCAQHLRNGDLVQSFRYKHQANKLREDRATRNADRIIQFIEVCNPDYWKESFSGIMDEMMRNELAKMNLEDCRRALVLHEMVHGNDRCPTYLAIRRRMEELGQ